jgi:hypothetical protein
MDEVHNEVVLNAKFAVSYQTLLSRLSRIMDSAIFSKSTVQHYTRTLGVIRLID